ncbi:MAG: SIR2 family NAD-dependent protein deacylase [Thermoplasmata archaeon]
MRALAGGEEIEVPNSILERVRAARRACVLTGAGVSAESGIPTFRGADGIWEKYDFRKLATSEGFRNDPRLVWEWYQLRQMEMMRAQPNPAHKAIADMEDHFESFTVLTQNIDGMHRRAGSKSIVELHGNIWRMRCPRDNTIVEIDSPVDELPPLCQCGGILRPDVVWFGEQLPSEAIEKAFQAASESEVMFVVGTSAVVYPAAALPALTKNAEGMVIEVNLEPTDVSMYADASFFGRAGEILPVLWQMILHPESFMTEHPIIRNR